MKASFILALIGIACGFTFSQSKIENDMEYAYQNAKKGIYWALENIPEKKSRIENNLIAEDKLYSTVKLVKAVNGIKIESTGYYNTNEVTIKIFRSNESLEQERFMKKQESSNSEKKD